MADFDLEALSLSELKKMQRDIVKALTTYEERQKAEARAKVDAFARELGYSLVELVDSDAKPKRAPFAPKYRHPENPAFTWSGRGRKPQWFVVALEAGKTAEDMAIG
jgi:DNA-binding protein H-NS